MLRKLSVTCLEIYFCEVDVRNVKNAKHNIWSLEYPIFSRAAVAARGGEEEMMTTESSNGN